ncbi:MAG: DUF1214 domain-containing protein [Rhizonema sp. PD37]|nr:DUF1214 domain-containing protein [Rhizonema sp. PD37]
MLSQKSLSVGFSVISFFTIALTNIGVNRVLADNSRLFNELESRVITNPTEAQKQQIAEAAFIYGYPLVAEKGKEYQDLAQQNPVNPEGSPLAIVNSQFNLNLRLSTPTDPFFGPNVDTLYGNAYLNLSQGPVTVTVPANPNNDFYSIDVLNAYVDTLGYIGDVGPSLTTPGSLNVTAPGSYYITPPGWRGNVPKGYTQIKSETNSIWLLSRTYVTNQASQDSLAYALNLQSGYTITAPGGSGYTQPTVESEFAGVFALGQTPLTPRQLADIATTPTDDPATALKAFQQLNADLSDNPLSVGGGGLSRAKLKNLIANFALIGIGDGKTGRPSSSGPTITEAQAVAALQAALRDTSASSGTLGSFGTNYLYRTQTARVGIAANQPQESIYFTPSTSDGTPLDGSKTYTITFPAGGLPPSLPGTNGFWSLSAYDARGFLIPNPDNIYSVATNTPNNLVFNADGSLTITLSATKPASGTANWLPIPAGSPFRLTGRDYLPTKAAQNDGYVFPSVVPVSTDK